MKFHTDENVSSAVSPGLRRRGLDATTTPEQGLLSADDDAQLDFCRKEKRVMVSHDTDMLRLAASGVPHCGIAYCHNQKYKPGQLVQRLLALSSRVTAEEMENRIEFL